MINCYLAIFCSPYSSALNPFEESFGTGMSWLKNHRDVAQQNPKYCMALALDLVKKSKVSLRC